MLTVRTALMERTLEAAERVQDLLSAESFVGAITHLLNHADPNVRSSSPVPDGTDPCALQVRRRALQHFGERLSGKRRRRARADDAAVFVRMAQTVADMLATRGTSEVRPVCLHSLRSAED
jgi:hypothetical protein